VTRLRDLQELSLFGDALRQQDLSMIHHQLGMLLWSARRGSGVKAVVVARIVGKLKSKIGAPNSITAEDEASISVEGGNTCDDNPI
jgi:hypothetical protein